MFNINVSIPPSLSPPFRILCINGQQHYKDYNISLQMRAVFIVYNQRASVGKNAGVRGEFDGTALHAFLAIRASRPGHDLFCFAKLEGGWYSVVQHARCSGEIGGL